MSFPSLRDVHQAMDAVFGDNAGAMPLRYGDPASEAAAARQRAGLFDRSDVGKVYVRGSDAADYLHRRLTNSISNLAEGAGCEAALLGGDARMIAAMTVSRIGRGFLVLAEPGLHEILRDELEKYVIAEDVKIDELRGKLGAIHVLGPQAGALASTLCPEAPADMAPWQIMRLEGIGAEAAFLCRRDLGRLPGRLLLTTQDRLAGLWGEAATEAKLLGGGPAGAEAFEILRLEEGEPRCGAEWGPRTIPLEANLKRLLDYTKGCYPGQEVIARVTNEGRQARALVGLRLDGEGPALPGAAVLAGGVRTGAVTSSAVSPALGPIALAGVEWEHRHAGAAVEIEGGRKAWIVGLPFDFPESKASG